MHRREFLKSAVAAVAAGPAALAQDERKVDARRLAGHRIAKFETFQLRDRFPREVGRNARGRPAGRGAGFKVRRVTTDQGATGWAMCYPPDEKLRPYVGRRLTDLFDVERGLLVDAEAPFLDLPLHDLAARILGVPVHEMIGGAGPKSLPVYSGAIYFEDLEERPVKGIAAVVAACEQDHAAGFRAFKLKTGRGAKWMEAKAGLRRDIEVVRAVRERFPDCRVLVDANNGWTVADACEFVKQVADCDLYFIEEPFEEERAGLVRLRETMAKHGCKAMIAEGESRHDRSEKWWKYGGYSERHIDRLYALARERLVDVFVTDLGIVGFSNWRRTMKELKDAGVRAAPHTWVWTPRTYYSAQLAAGVGNVCMVEGIPGGAKGIDYATWKIDDGKLVVPDAPGMGLELRL